MDDVPTVTLPARQLFEIPDAASARILCTEGCLWLTLDDDPRDVILEPGDSFRTDEHRRALLYALQGSSFVLSADSRSAGAVVATDAPRSARSAVWSATPAARPA